MSDTTPPSSTPTGSGDENWMKDRAQELSEQAKERAALAREKAGPAAAAAKERANDLADKAAPAVSKGLGSLAGRLNRMTKGKYADKIDAATSKAQEALDRDDPSTGPTPGGSVPPA